ncbi:unnamed protein product [Chrysoparadoxa australica]
MEDNGDDDEAVARVMFLSGLCFLPGLWVVNVLYFRDKLQAGTLSPEARRWVTRSAVGSVVVIILFFCWGAFFRAYWKRLGLGWFMVCWPEEMRSEW